MCDVDIKLNGERVDCGTRPRADARGAAGGGKGIGRGRMGAKGGFKGDAHLDPRGQGVAEADRHNSRGNDRAETRRQPVKSDTRNAFQENGLKQTIFEEEDNTSHQI